MIRALLGSLCIEFVRSAAKLRPRNGLRKAQVPAQDDLLQVEQATTIGCATNL